MTDDVRNLIRFVVDGDIRNAQTQCRIMLEKNVPEKDARFKENELRKLNLLKPERIQLPANLENLLIAEDATNFPESRFLLREEEETVINKLLATRKAALAIKELGIHYTCSLLLTGLPGVGKTELAHYRYSRTDLYTKFGESYSTDYKKGAVQEKLDSFLKMRLNLADDACVSLFRTDTVKNYYGYFEVFWPSSPYLMRVIAAIYKNDSADAMQPSLEDFKYLTKDAQYRILTEKCKTAKTEDDAFAVISCLETQPQTVRKLLFAKEYFRDAYMLLNDADRMFADILISDCAGCVKLLKSLQKEVEEKA